MIIDLVEPTRLIVGFKHGHFLVLVVVVGWGYKQTNSRLTLDL
jgi:hypothetical protein